MKTIIVLDYSVADVHIIHNVPDQEDFDKFLKFNCNYRLDQIAYMVVDAKKKIEPRHFNPQDFC